MWTKFKKYLSIKFSFDIPNDRLFSFNQKLGHVIGIYPTQSNDNGRPFTWRNWVFPIGTAIFALSSAAYIYFEASSMFEYGKSSIAVNSGIFTIGMYATMFRQREKTRALIENCETFIEKRADSEIAYKKNIENIDRSCRWLVVAMQVSILFMYLPLLLYSYFNYCILELGPNSYFLVYPVKLPFDWKTPLGYPVAWFAQYAELLALASIFILLINYVVATCWLFVFMVKDITMDLTAFNNDIKSNKNRDEWVKRLGDIIHLYSDVKQLVFEANAALKHPLFLIIFVCMLNQTSILLTLQFQLLDENFKHLEIISNLVIAIWMYVLLFLFCELGERVTIQFDIFCEELQRCDWHELPIEMQRMYWLFLSDAQQTKHIECFFNILCTRETFKLIVKTSWSYFMTIRQFEV